MKTNKFSILLIIAAFTIVSCEKDQYTSGRYSDDNVNQFDADEQVSNDQSETGLGEERNLSCLLLPSADYNKLPKMADVPSIQVIPSSFVMLCPPVRSQGQEGSCVAWGVGYAARSIMRKYQVGGSYTDSTNIFSPEFIYNKIKATSNCGGGAYVYRGLNMVRDTGVCRWKQMPYSSTNGCSLMPTSAQYSAALPYKVNSWSTVTRTASNFKNLLYLKKPIIVAGPVDQTYANHFGPSVITSYNSSTYIGNHCYCVVGYDDTKNAFRVMNSWGTSWGDGGYAWISYNLMNTLFTEAYVMN